MAAPPRVVTFDFWNTLVRADDGGARDRRLTTWLGLLAGEGLEVGRDAVGEAMAHAGQRFDEHWRANRFYGARQAVLDALDHLGIEASPAFVERLVASITDPAPDHDPQPAPGVGDALEALRSAGVRLGIICDVGLAPSPTLRRYLDRHGLLGHFDHWSFSDEVGVFKPHPVIFRHALDGLGGPDPAEAAHVGDLRRTDIAGARAAGMVAVRYSGVADDPGSVEAGTHEVEGDLVVTDHRDLPALLGIT